MTRAVNQKLRKAMQDEGRVARIEGYDRQRAELIAERVRQWKSITGA